MPGTPAELTTRALQQRPELHAAQATLEQAKVAIEAEKSGYRPRLSGSAGVSASADPRTPAAASGAATVGLDLDGSLLDRGDTHSNVVQAQQQLKIEEARLEQQEWAIRGEVQEALSSRDAAVASKEASERRLAAATEAVRLMEARYEAGAALYAELAAAHLALLQAQRAQVQALSDLNRAEWFLRWAVGEGL